MGNYSCVEIHADGKMHQNQTSTDVILFALLPSQVGESRYTSCQPIALVGLTLIHYWRRCPGNGQTESQRPDHLSDPDMYITYLGQPVMLPIRTVLILMGALPIYAGAYGRHKWIGLFVPEETIPFVTWSESPMHLLKASSPPASPW